MKTSKIILVFTAIALLACTLCACGKTVSHSESDGQHKYAFGQDIVQLSNCSEKDLNAELEYFRNYSELEDTEMKVTNGKLSISCPDLPALKNAVSFYHIVLSNNFRKDGAKAVLSDDLKTLDITVNAVTAMGDLEKEVGIMEFYIALDQTLQNPGDTYAFVLNLYKAGVETPIKTVSSDKPFTFSEAEFKKHFGDDVETITFGPDFLEEGTDMSLLYMLLHNDFREEVVNLEEGNDSVTATLAENSSFFPEGTNTAQRIQRDAERYSDILGKQITISEDWTTITVSSYAPEGEDAVVEDTPEEQEDLLAELALKCKLQQALDKGTTEGCSVTIVME